MKKNKILIALLCGVSGMQSITDAFHHASVDTIAPYHNKILDIDMIMENNVQVVVQLQFDPICIYTPMTYDEIHNQDAEQTYFLPRTHFRDLNSNKMHNIIDQLFERFGITLSFEKVAGKNYGMRMIFTCQHGNRYDVIKAVDAHHKTVTFNFVK
jgi:hypothetical protein